MCPYKFCLPGYTIHQLLMTIKYIMEMLKCYNHSAVEGRVIAVNDTTMYI